MPTIHSYRLSGQWSGTRQSVGHIEASGLTSDISIPANLNGPGVGTNPEELLLSAAAGCYMITLSTILNNRQIPYVRIDLDSVGIVEDDHGLRFDRIEHRPTIIVDESVDESLLCAYAVHAEHACMISSALRGNVQVTVTPRVVTQAVSL